MTKYITQSASLHKYDQHSQKLISCAVVPFIRMIEPYLDKSKPQPQPKESLLLASYSLQLVASALSSISHKRRDLVRPMLGDQFRRLCSPRNSVSVLLLGDDLVKQVKDINDSEKLRKEMRLPASDARRPSSNNYKRPSPATAAQNPHRAGDGQYGHGHYGHVPMAHLNSKTGPMATDA